MYQILLVFHLTIAVILIALIMIQQGKGAQTGAAFGSGASTTVFGSQGSGNFLTRTTAILVTLFFIINLLLANLTNRYSKGDPLEDLNLITPSQEVGDLVAPQETTPTTIPVEGPQGTSIPE